MKILVAAPTGLCFGVKRAIGFVEKRWRKRRLFTRSAVRSTIRRRSSVCKDGAARRPIRDGDPRRRDGVDPCPRGGPRRAGKSEEKKRQRHRRHVPLRARGTGACAGIVRGRLSRSDPRERETSRDGRYPRLCPRTFDGDFDDSVTFSSTIFKSSVKIHKLGLVSQTTQEESLLAEAAKAALGVADELRIYNTICRATIERQEAVRRLASQVEGMIVIGGHNSANTGKLCRIARDSSCDAVWIEHAGQLDRRWVLEKRVIGIAAGASTPDWLIEQLHNAIHNIAGRQGDVRNE